MPTIYSQLCKVESSISGIKASFPDGNMPIAVADNLDRLTKLQRELDAAWEKKSPRTQLIAQLKQEIAEFRPFKIYNLPPKPAAPDLDRLNTARTRADRVALTGDARARDRAVRALAEARRVYARQEANLAAWLRRKADREGDMAANTIGLARQRERIEQLAQLTAPRLAPRLRRKRAPSQTWPEPRGLRECYGYDPSTGAITRPSGKRIFFIRSLSQRLTLRGVKVPASYLLCALTELPYAPGKHRLTSTAPPGEAFPFARRWLTLTPTEQTQ